MLAKKIALGFAVAIVLPLLIHFGVSTFTGPDRFDKNSQYRTDHVSFARNMILYAAPLGVIAIVGGLFIPVQSLGAGLIFGGIISVLEAYGMYWPYLTDLIRLISLLTAFIALMAVGYLKFRDKKES